MAASVGAGGSKYKDKTKLAKVPEQLNLTSPLFDPLKALRSKEVFLPCPDVKPFDNLAKYESSTKVQKSSKSKSRKTEETDSEKKPTTQAVDTINKTIEVEISSQLSRIRVKSNADLKLNTDERSKKEKAKEHDNSLHALRRKKRQRNVVTRMKEHEKGPLSFLKRCVENRHVVKVWTRSAYEWRGYCTGYLVAFDNHFNLAVMDVDEIYRKPTVQDRRNEFRNKVPVESDVSPDTKVFEETSGNVDQTLGNFDQSLSNVNLPSGDVDQVSRKNWETKENPVTSAQDLKSKEGVKQMNLLSVESKSAESASSIFHADDDQESVHTKSVTERSEHCTTSVISSITAMTNLKLDDSQTVKQTVPQKKSSDGRKVEACSEKSEKYSVTDVDEKYLLTNTDEKYLLTNTDEKYSVKKSGEIKSLKKEKKEGGSKDETGDKKPSIKQSRKVLHRCVKSDTSSTSSSTESSDNESVHKESKSKYTGRVTKIKQRVVPLEECTKMKLLHRHVNQLFIREIM